MPTVLNQTLANSLITVSLLQNAAANTGVVQSGIVTTHLDDDSLLFQTGSVVSPIIQLWNLRNSASFVPTKADAVTDADYNAMFSINTLLGSIPRSYANSDFKSSMIDDLLSLRNPVEKTLIFSNWASFIAALKESTIGLNCIDLADVDNVWKKCAIKITLTDTILAGDIAQYLKNWAAIKVRMDYAADFNNFISVTPPNYVNTGIFDTVVSTKATTAEAGDAATALTGYFAGARPAANAKTAMIAFVGKAIETKGAAAGDAPVANPKLGDQATAGTVINVLATGLNKDTNSTTATLLVIKTLYTATGLLKLNAGAAIEEATYTFVDYASPTLAPSIDKAFKYVNYFFPKATREEFVNLFKDVFAAKKFIFDRIITVDLLSKYYATIKPADIIAFVGSAGLTLNGTIQSWPALINYSPVINTSTLVSSVFSAQFCVLAKLGYSAKVAFDACLANILSVDQGATEPDAATEGIRIALRARDFDSYFGNYIKGLPLVDRLAGLKTLKTTPEKNLTPIFNLLTGADTQESIFTAILNNSGTLNPIFSLASFTPVNIIVGQIVDPITIRTIVIADAMQVNKPTVPTINTSSQAFGPPAMDYDTLYNKIPKFATEFVEMFSFNNNSYVISSKNSATANSANQCTTFLPNDANFVLSKPKNDNAFFEAIAKKYMLQPAIALLPKPDIRVVSQNFELANKAATTTDLAAETVLNSLIFSDGYDAQNLLNLSTFQPWMQGDKNQNGSIVKLFMMMIVDATTNKWNASYYATQLLKYASVGTNGLAICAEAVKAITTTASIGAQTDEANKATNATTIYNVLVQSASPLTNDVDCANIQTMMGSDTTTQLKQLDLILTKITLPQLSKYSYFFTSAAYSLSDLLGNLTPLTLQTTGLSNTTLGSQAWPTLLSNKIAFLAGKDDKVQVSPAIILSYFRTITICDKSSGQSASSTSTATKFVFKPVDIQTAYGLTSEELNSLGLEQGFSFI